MISGKDISRIIRKMRIKQGDVVVVKGGTALANWIFSNMREVEYTFRKNNLTNVLIVAADDPNDLTALDEKQMAEQGWYKGTSISSLVLKRYQEQHKESEDELKV